MQYNRGDPVYNELVIQASDRLTSLAFRICSGATKRSRLDARMNIVYKVPLKGPYDGISSDIIVGKNVNIDTGRFTFWIESEYSYRTDYETGKEVEVDDFQFTGFMTVTPANELVEITVVLREKRPTASELKKKLFDFPGYFSIVGK